MPTKTDSTSLRVRQTPIAKLTPYAQNARKHPKRQVAALKRSIERFGFVQPVLVDDAGVLIAGHGRVEAARQLGMAKVPTVTLSHLTADQVRELRLADNKLAELASWDQSTLAIEAADLQAANLADLGWTKGDLAKLAGDPPAAKTGQRAGSDKTGQQRLTFVVDPDDSDDVARALDAAAGDVGDVANPRGAALAVLARAYLEGV